jgi:hypothetical protein
MKHLKATRGEKKSTSHRIVTEHVLQSALACLRWKRAWALEPLVYAHARAVRTGLSKICMYHGRLLRKTKLLGQAWFTLSPAQLVSNTRSTRPARAADDTEVTQGIRS